MSDDDIAALVYEARQAAAYLPRLRTDPEGCALMRRMADVLDPRPDVAGLVAEARMHRGGPIPANINDLLRRLADALERAAWRDPPL